MVLLNAFNSTSEFCQACTRGFCTLCTNPSDQDECCCGGSFNEAAEVETKRERFDSGLMEALSESLSNPVGRPRKEDTDLDNPLSAGRKRAAAENPILPGTICEWSKLKAAGGGVMPIIGCLGNIATDLHHGPDKSTLNNERVVNLHQICSPCHNRWHGENDRYYDEPRPVDNSTWEPNREFKQHDAVTEATIPEILEHEEKWRERRQDKKRITH